MKYSRPFALNISPLCVSVLLSFSPALAQTYQSPEATARYQLSTSQSPEPDPKLLGTYRLADRDADNWIRKAIEASLEGIPSAARDKARNLLEKRNLPAARMINISYTPTEVSITTDLSPTIQRPSDGTPIDWTIDGETFKVSARWDDGKLKQTFDGAEYQRVNIYELGADGKTLIVHATVTSAALPQPLKYELFYERTASPLRETMGVASKGASNRKLSDGLTRKQSDGVPAAYAARLRMATQSAQSEVEDQFTSLKSKPVKIHAENTQVADDRRQGYEVKEVVESMRAGKTRLMQALKGDEFAGLRAYTEVFFKVPTKTDFETIKLRHEDSELITLEAKNRALEYSLQFIQKLESLSVPGRLIVDVTVNSEPAMADYDMWPSGGSHLTTTTNNTLKNVPRGYYTYKLSKPGYKTIEQPLNLLDGGSRLDCTLNKTDDSDGPHACRQQ